jgi:hypothetical protein
MAKREGRRRIPIAVSVPFIIAVVLLGMVLSSMLFDFGGRSGHGSGHERQTAARHGFNRGHEAGGDHAGGDHPGRDHSGGDHPGRNHSRQAHRSGDGTKTDRHGSPDHSGGDHSGGDHSGGDHSGA